MRTDEAKAYFPTIVEMAKAAKVSRQATYKWGKYVPQVSAYYISLATNGELAYDEDFYTRLRRNRIKCARELADKLGLDTSLPEDDD